MNTDRDTSILVVGTGPVGLVAALAFAAAGHQVTLVGPQIAKSDRRTSAIMAPGLELLGRLGVMGAVESHGAPLETLRIIDGTNRLLRSPTVTFRASEIDLDRFGVNIPNAALLSILAEAIATRPEIRWTESTVSEWTLTPDAATARLANGEAIEARLVAAADGRNSPARTAAGIDTSQHAYPQSAVVLNFGHSRCHDFTSNEFHTQTGPFTQVPLPGQRSSLVWVVDPKHAEELAALDDADISRAVEDKMQSMLGRVTVEPGRQIFPLMSSIARIFGAKRIALVGEAAHVVPPIGAQGLNLGLADVAALVEGVSATANDPGSDEILRRYSATRRGSVVPRITGIDLLNRSLLSDLLPAQAVRATGLGLLRSIPPLRAFSMREGLRPGSGMRGMLSGLGKQVRR